jgi:hypothetical protein
LSRPRDFPSSGVTLTTIYSHTYHDLVACRTKAVEQRCWRYASGIRYWSFAAHGSAILAEALPAILHLHHPDTYRAGPDNKPVHLPVRRTFCQPALRRLDAQISARGVTVNSMSTLTCGTLGTDKTLEPSNLQAAVTFNAQGRPAVVCIPSLPAQGRICLG